MAQGMLQVQDLQLAAHTEHLQGRREGDLLPRLLHGQIAAVRDKQKGPRERPQSASCQLTKIVAKKWKQE
jgi:hypothetical protein